MLHIQVPVCLTYHLHVSMPVAQSSSRVLSTAVRAVKRDSCVPVFLYALRGHTRPGYISWGGGRERTAHNHLYRLFCFLCL